MPQVAEIERWKLGGRGNLVSSGAYRANMSIDQNTQKAIDESRSVQPPPSAPEERNDTKMEEEEQPPEPVVAFKEEPQRKRRHKREEIRPAPEPKQNDGLLAVGALVGGIGAIILFAFAIERSKAR